MKNSEKVHTNEESSVEDVYAGSHLIPDSNQERYLGNIINSSGKNDSNIAAQVSKGQGIIKQIMNILGDICFEKFNFLAAKILRESLFLNRILLNSEAWFSVSKSNIEELEKIDNL